MDIKIQSKAAFNLVKVKPPSPSLQNDCANQQVNGGSYFNFNFLSNFPPGFPCHFPGDNGCNQLPQIAVRTVQHLSS